LNSLSRLQAWYARQCNGTWEHAFGIHIESCDNPGWWVKVRLTGTALQDRPFREIAEGVDSQRFAVAPSWLSCHVEENTWHGAGDESKLENILEVFLSWAESNDV
jgi:hypothetical protein